MRQAAPLFFELGGVCGGREACMSAVISLSSSAFSPDCEEVVALLRTLKIAGDVTPNRTLLPADRAEETGCRVVLSDASQKNAERAWRHARRLPGVTCAHVRLTQHAEGCAWDVFSPSLCPGSKDH